MHIVDRIFETLDGATAISRETGDPIQTVHSWKAVGNIPRWRRPALIALASRMERALDPDALAYLASRENLPKRTTPLNDRRSAAA
jgi:hypothetical protein